jgi:hypothetical protein
LSVSPLQAYLPAGREKNAANEQMPKRDFMLPPMLFMTLPKNYRRSLNYFQAGTDPDIDRS